jgi:hypothetical protein
MRRARTLRRRYGRSAAGGMYMVRLVHKISPSDRDTFGPVHFSLSDLESKVAIGKALRRAHAEGGMRTALAPGQAIKSFRNEAGGKVVAFPSNRSIWHAIVLTPVGS